ncbi:hypothetical protein BN14_03667 [Rhizoctonia solani AG-1 IB]|uniref:Uncharacterized protein n=1 Tax=Thanatephorus cucumeris (strain AG1-IB / isolate 7/3/14) TaxID=1108050 RepID=M5BR09_THACB|nr:hypothetical protein BN14_03667 [Rhizoctonia solani AG-1 IB]
MSNEPTFSIRLRHLLTGEEHDRGYDAIILGTGYERQSWMRLFGQGERKDVAPLSEVFGLTPLAPIRLLPVIESEATKSAESLSKLDVVEAIAAKVQGAQPLTPPRSGATTPPSPAESTEAHSPRVYRRQVFASLVLTVCFRSTNTPILLPVSMFKDAPNRLMD